MSENIVICTICLKESYDWYIFAVPIFNTDAFKYWDLCFRQTASKLSVVCEYDRFSRGVQIKLPLTPVTRKSVARCCILSRKLIWDHVCVYVTFFFSLFLRWLASCQTQSGHLWKSRKDKFRWGLTKFLIAIFSYYSLFNQKVHFNMFSVLTKIYL